MPEEKVIRVKVEHELSRETEQYIDRVTDNIMQDLSEIVETFGRVFGSQY
jgi:hypothetical protein